MYDRRLDAILAAAKAGSFSQAARHLHISSTAFNACARSGDLLLAKSIWSNFHPSFRLVPMDWDITVPYGLLYPQHPTQAVADFVTAVQRELA